MEIRREKAEKCCAIVVREPGLEDSCPGGFRECRLGMGGRPHEGRNGPRERLRPCEVVLGPALGDAPGVEVEPDAFDAPELSNLRREQAKRGHLPRHSLKP